MRKTYENNSASKEDYLELIYELSQDNANFKAVDIANKMNISRASVSEALKKLSEQGYIVYEKYKQAALTAKGLETAKKVLNKHNVLCKFFKEYLNLSEEEAQINACRIEHVITETAFQKIQDIVNKKA
ncbi:MAG: metal-dependent transcriptional regulator [Candidatus Gastranaerophilales bacterium]|nr:metal-dependent transcriptional regulator [Candidatus Gastranaerophilales bacterium]